MSKPTLLFDFDGVIVDSFDVLLGIAQEIRPGVDAETYRRYFDGNIYDTKRSLESRAKGIQIDEVNRRILDLHAERVVKLDPYQGMAEILAATDHTKHVVSSAWSQSVDQFLKTHALRHHVGEIYGADVDINKERKIRSLMEKFGSGPSETLFVTDTLGDLHEARKAGVDAVGVTWGFHDRGTLERGEPHAIVDSPAELQKVIEAYFKE